MPDKLTGIQIGTHDQFSADLLICRRGGAVFRALEPDLEFEQFGPDGNWPRIGWHEQKFALYRSQDGNYNWVLTVAYRPNSNRPEAFALNNTPHGYNIASNLIDVIGDLLFRGKVRTIGLTSLSWRNLEMMDHVLATVLVETRQYLKIKNGRLMLILPCPRPKLIALVEQEYSICTTYFKSLEAAYQV